MRLIVQLDGTFGSAGLRSIDIVKRDTHQYRWEFRVGDDHVAARRRCDIVSKSSTLTKPDMAARRCPGNVHAFDTEEALLLLDQIKRDKGVWWMPRQ
jgi:hypothetical protein